MAHPTVIGTHGDYENEGNILEEICFENLDILEHREHQADYLECMAVNVGDKNTARNICYEDIRIEQIHLKNIYYTGQGEEKSCICGYSADCMVCNVTIENLYIRGRKAETLEEAGISVGPWAENIHIQ